MGRAGIVKKIKEREGEQEVSKFIVKWSV